MQYQQITNILQGARFLVCSERAFTARYTPKIENSSNFREALNIIVLTIDEFAKRKVPKSKQPGAIPAVFLVLHICLPRHPSG
jgi:oligoribonuclease (3'-5' exoribonuclease)